MARVNRFPRGFLELLSIKSDGATPGDISEIVAPVLGMNEFYMAEDLAGYQLTATHAGAPASFSMTPGVNETWLLRGLGVNTNNLAVGDFEAWHAVIGTVTAGENSSDPQPSPVVWSSDRLDILTVGDSLSFSHNFPVPFIVAPGSNVTFSIRQRDTSPSRSSNLTAWFTLLE